MRFGNVREVYEPAKTGTPNAVEAPKDMVGWFRRHPYLQADEPEPVTVEGAKGEQFAVVVGDLTEAYSLGYARRYAWTSSGPATILPWPSRRGTRRA